MLHERLRKRLGFAAMAVLLCVPLFAGGCGGDGDETRQENVNLTEEDRQLQSLLPDKEGYTWVYSGFAEYGHQMTLNSIQVESSQMTYEVSGKVDDMSAGESKADNDITLRYTIKDGRLLQEKHGPMMMDEFDKMQLLVAPFEQGTVWEQKVVNREGNEIALKCQVTSVGEEDGVPVYDVLYQEQDGSYYERRKIKEGVGVTAYAKLWQADGQSFEVSYFLYEDASGYQE